MMKRICPTIIVVFFMFFNPIRLEAQRINVYASAGTITSQIEGDELKGFGHWGFIGGVGAMVALDDNDRWSLSLESTYSGRGVRNTSNNVQNPYNIDLNLHYVDIPLAVYFKDPYGGINIGIGLMYSRLLSQPHGTISYRPTYFVPDTTDMSFLKNDLSPVIELRFTIWEKLQFSARYQFSVIPIKKDWHFLEKIDAENDKVWSNDCFSSAATFRLIWQFGDNSQSHRKSSYKKSHKRRR